MAIEDDLLRAGWDPERQIDPAAAIRALEAEGWATWPGLVNFLESFSGLEVTGGDGKRTVFIDAGNASANIDPGWGTAYSKALGVRLAPVGEQSHMTIYLGEDGAFYGGFDHDYGRLGADIFETLEAVLYFRPGMPGFDRHLPTE